MIVMSIVVFEVGNGSRRTFRSTWDDGYTAHPKITMLLLKKYVVSYKLIIRHIKKSSLSYRTNGNPELIQIALNPKWQENKKEKHNEIAKYGWYRYDVKFAIPIYENNKLVRYNIFGARLLVNHSYNGKKYLYDIVAIKKETSKPHH